MSRIVDAFKTAKRQGRAAFIPYVTCGDPSLEQSVAIAAALECLKCKLASVKLLGSYPIG